MQQQGENEMDEKEIRQRARGYWKKTNRKYYSWREGFRLVSKLCPTYAKPHREWLNAEELEPEYALRILEKKKLLSQETKRNLYKIVGDAYLNDWVFSEAKKYYLFAGRQDLLKTINIEQEKARKWCKEREKYVRESEKKDRKFEEFMSDPENFKNN